LLIVILKVLALLSIGVCIVLFPEVQVAVAGRTVRVGISVYNAENGYARNLKKCQVPRTRNQVPRTKYQVPSIKYQEPSTKYQVPKTKNQKPKTKNQKPKTKNTPYPVFYHIP